MSASAPLLRTARDRKGWTQARLGDIAGYSRETTQRLEAGAPMPEDARVRLAEVLDAPELLIAPDSPLNPAWLGRVGGPLEAIGWLREEMTEALAALERQEKSIRHRQTDPRLHEELAGQVYDLVTAVGAYAVAVSHGLDLSLARIHAAHRVKVKRHIRVDLREAA